MTKSIRYNMNVDHSLIKEYLGMDGTANCVIASSLT